MPASLRPLIHRVATLCAMALMVVTMGGASCITVMFPTEDVDAGTTPGRACGEGVICTPGCSDENITNRGGEVCAECATGQGQVEICGAVTSSTCFTVESPFGGPCQQCFTESGQVLFDNCEEGQDVLIEVTCREVPRSEDNDAESCEVCTDEVGRVVSRTCRPEADTCASVFDNGLACQECTLDGVFAYRECTPARIEPRTCETYGNENGQCLDCYGRSDELLLHICAFDDAGNDERVCDEYVNFDGEYCRECFNPASGEMLEQFCEPTGPQPTERCERLVFSQADCTVCTVDGQVTFSECTSDCRDNDPTDPDVACPENCFLSQLSDTNACFQCFDPQTGDFEEQCTQGQVDLQCESVIETIVVDPNDRPGAPAPALECREDGDCPQGQVCDANGFCLTEGSNSLVAEQECLVCVDPATQEEVYRSCEQVGTPNQPECFVSEDQFGDRCEVCVDPETGNEFFNSCGNGEPQPPPPPPNDCFEREMPAVDGNGGVYETEVNGSVEPVILMCIECPADQMQECSLDERYCADNNCNENFITMGFAPNQCGLPWGDEFMFRPDELGRIAGWLLGEVGVTVLNVNLVGGVVDPQCNNANDCECPRGDYLTVLVGASESDVLAAFGFEPF